MGNSMVPFTKDEMEAELREIYAAQASHIAHVGNNEAANIFLGFEWEFSPWEDTLDEVASKIDLTRFKATEYMSVAYDYAFQVGHFRAYDECVHMDVIGFDCGVPAYASCGIGPAYRHRPDSKCRHVVDMAMARWYLDGNEDVSALSIRQLAVLAGMKEGAVRNSLSSEKIKTEGSPASVSMEIAREWLKKRKGFIPSIFEDCSKEQWQADARILLAGDFVTAMENILARLQLKPEEAANKADVPLEYFVSLLGGKHGSDNISNLQRVAVALDLDAPQFVGRAIEVALRHSAGPH
jgi:hypothetical protein